LALHLEPRDTGPGVESESGTMTGTEDIPERIKDLIDEYLDDSPDDGRLKELEDLLRSSEEVRRYFVRYCDLHAELWLLAWGRRISGIIIDPGRVDEAPRIGPG